MIIQTTRFGSVEIGSTDIIDFPEGILGFAGLRKFVLLDDPGDEIFAWLQSCESAAVAFPILEPTLFNSQYKVNLTRMDLELLGLTKEKIPMIFAIVTIPEDPRLMTANLKAPVVINVDKRIARQVVLQEPDLAIREPIFAKLQQRVVQPMGQREKTRAVDLGMAIRLPEMQPEVTNKSLQTP